MRYRGLTFFFLVLLTASAAVEAQTRLLRFPDIHGERVVFTYAGDLWLASTDGGKASRVTTHPGVELFAKFSPDGQWIAFTGQYDGDEQVYVVPTAGGSPRQLTYYPALGPLPPRWGYDNQVYGWTSDGSRVLFRSFRDGWDLGDAQLFTVSVAGGLPEALPMPESGAGDFSPDNGKIVYSPLSRDFRHWKRYQGGWAQDLYIFDLKSHQTERVTDHPRTDRDPMWIGDHIYFASDRDDKLNLYRYDPASRSTQQLTHQTRWDVRWPSADEAGRIVYELNGQLEILETSSGTSRALEIQVPDDGIASRPSRVSAASRISDIALAPEGRRALFAARGDIFSAPIEHGRTRNLTRSSGAHDRAPAWSPDGRRIAFVSDQSGEDEIYLVPQDGSEAPRQLTQDSVSRRYEGLVWSPDNRHIAVRDQTGKLTVVDAQNGDKIEIADDMSAFGLEYDWSPGGEYLALSLAGPNTLRSLHIWSLGDRQLHRVTDDAFNERSPSWSPDGQYLFYLSEREFHPQLGAFEFNYVVNKATQIYALTLREDVPHPFPPRSDEVEAKGGEEKNEDEATAPGDEAPKGKGKKKKGPKNRAKKADEATPLTIDFEGLADRVVRVPVEADNYGAVVAAEGHLLYLVGGPPYYGRESDRPTEIRIFSLEERKEKNLASHLARAALSPDRSKLLVEKQGGFRLFPINMSAKEGKAVSTAGLQVDLVPTEEWAQIFDEVWRRFRDFFYDEKMHGYDWQELRERYRPLLAHVGHRSDLNYVMSEMIAELNVSHAYVTGGDFEIPPRPRAGLLGARFDLDKEAGRFRLTEIFSGHNEEDAFRSPLTEPGARVAEGDYILEINGQALESNDNPYRLLRHAGGAPVELRISRNTDGSDAKRITIRPIASEDELLYLRWTQRNRERVRELSQGRLGYIHLPDMGGDGIREFVKWFYSQNRKQGLVIDVRSNGGGNVSQMILERLQRKLLMFDFERHTDYHDPYPGAVFHGHLACLLDEDTASDGDQFAWVFRQAGLGPLIGKRSWGGVVGIYGRPPLIDGGGVSVPEAGSTDAQGNWVIEGHGVDPDIVVENPPEAVLAGRDPQLEKAIEVLLEKIEREPLSFPPRPAAPNKTQ